MTTTLSAPAATAAPVSVATVAPFSLTVEADALKRALRLVKRAAGAKRDHDVFRAVRLEETIHGARVTCSGHDLQIGVEIVGAGSSGSAAIRHDVLEAAVRGAGKGDAVDVWNDGEGYAVRVRGAVSRVAAVPLADLPETMDALNREPRFILAASAFVAGLESVGSARAVETMRFALTGIMLEVRPEFGGALPMVATDGRRLHVVNVRGANVTADRMLGAKADVILKTGAVDAAIAAWSGKAGLGLAVVCEAGDASVSLSAGGVRIIARREEGSFPSWRCVVPGTGEPGSGSLLDAVRILDVPAAVRAFRDIARQAPRDAACVRVTVRDGEIGLEAKWSDGGFSAVLATESSVGGWTGDPTTFGANPSFIADALEAGCDRLQPMGLTKREVLPAGAWKSSAKTAEADRVYVYENTSPFLLSASPAAPGGALAVRCVVMPVSLA